MSLAQLQAMLEAAEAKQAAQPGLDRGLDPRLHGYQRRAVQHLWDNPQAGLFLEMGLGKTAATLQALTPDHLPALVIAPKRVAEHVWSTEAAIWRPDLTVAVAAGTRPKRTKAIYSDADVVVIGRDNIRDIEPGQFKTIVLDELSGFKNRGSQRWKHARKLTDAASYVWGLTGTPSPNGLMDLWAQLALLDSGKRLGKTLTSYRRKFFFPGRQLPTGVVIEWNLREGAESGIHEAISDICLSMTSDDHLDLDPINYNRVEVPLPAKSRRVYESLLKDLVVDLTDSDGEVHTAANAAVATGKLSQITAGFLYSDDVDSDAVEQLHDEKTSAVVEIVEGTGSPVLVFYRFRAELARLLKALPQARTIDSPNAIEDWNAGRVPVLLAHPASAGHGLNLQAGGHTIVWSTMPWSLEEWGQANARLARQGQTQPVIVHQLISPDTIDEQILDRLINKTSTQDAVMTALKGARK